MIYLRFLPFLFTFLLMTACGGGGGGNDAPVLPSNQSPNVTVSAPSVVAMLAEVTLDAGSSTDQDGSISSYQWEQLSGTDVTLSDTTLAVVTFDAPNEASVVMQFRVTVTDNEGSSSNSTVTVTTNTPPLADAGVDTQVIETKSVELSGAQSSDPDENIVSYSWRQLSGVPTPITSSSQKTASIVAPEVEIDTELVFELIVEDEFDTSSIDTVTVFVLANQAPIVEVFFPLDGARYEGNEISVSGKVTDDRDVSQNTVTISTNEAQVIATVDENGLFSVDFPLDSSIPDTDISITAEDNINETSLAKHLNLRNEPLITKGRMVMHPSRVNIALFIDDTYKQNRVYEIDLMLGTTKIVFEEEESEFGQVLDVKVDVANNRLLVNGFARGYSFTAIDLENYSYTKLVPTELDGQITIGYSWTFSVIPGGDEVLIADNQNGVLVKADLTSGSRNIVSGPEVGTGLSFTENIVPIVTDAGDWIVLDTSQQTTFLVDQETGNRTVLGSIGGGLYSGSKVLDESRQKVVSVRINDPLVRILDLKTGEVETLLNLQERFDSSSVWQVLHDELSDRYILMQFGDNSGDKDIDNVVSIDPETLETEVLFDGYVGQGEKIKINGEVVFDPQRKRLYGISDLNSVYSFDPETLSTQIVSQNDSGDVIEFQSLSRIALNPQSGSLYVTDRLAQSIVSIAPDTAQKTMIWDISQSDEYQTSVAQDIDFSKNGELMYVLLKSADAEFSLVSYSLASSEIALITNNQVGNNSSFIQPNSISVKGDVVYIADDGTGATSSITIQEINIETGNTEIITRGTINSSVYIETMPELNNLLVTESGNLRLIDIETGNVEILSFPRADFRVGRGPQAYFQYFTVDFSTSTIYAVDPINEILFSTDINSGDRLILQRQ